MRYQSLKPTFFGNNMARFIEIPQPSRKVEFVNSDFVIRVEFYPASNPPTVEFFFVEAQSLVSCQVRFQTKEQASDWIEKNFILFNK